jgi:type I restriction enzyme S subunit
MEVAAQKKVMVPKLRFREFEGDWMEGRVSELSSKLKVGFVGTCEPFYTNSEDGVLLVRTGNLKGVNIVLDEVKYVSKAFHAANKKSQLFPNDLVLARHGGNGEICKIPNDFPEANSLNIVVLRTKDVLDSTFFQLCYGSPFIQRQINAVTAGSTQGVINTGEIGKLKIFYPKSHEQQKIASFLSAVDARIGHLTRKKELLEQYKKGVMQRIFNYDKADEQEDYDGKEETASSQSIKGHQSHHSSRPLRFKREDGSDYEEWEEKRLGEVAVFAKGKGISKSDIVEDGATPCIRYGELYTHYQERIDRIVSRTDVAPSQLNFSKANDVIIPSSGETQLDIAKASCVMMAGIALGGDLNVIRTKQDGLFLAYYMNSAKKFEIAQMAQGNSVVHLYSSQLKDLAIQLPCLEEQQKIAAFLSGLDKKIEAVGAQIELTQQFKKGLLQEMFV